MTISRGDKNDMGISSLNICAIETKSIVGINSLGVTGSSLHCEGAMEKRLTVNNVGCNVVTRDLLTESLSSRLDAQ